MNMEDPTFCGRCGTELKPENQFCPKCGAEIGKPTAPPQPVQPTVTPSQPSNKLWAIDKRFFILALIVLVLVLPVFPRDKVIYVDGQTLTTQTVQSLSYATSYAPYSTVTQRTIQVYVGTIQYVNQQWYGYYYTGGFYNNCYWVHGHVYCVYQNWPYYNTYTVTVNVDAAQRIIRVDRSQASYGLETITLWRDDGTSAGSYSNVVADTLDQTGSTTVQNTVAGTNTVVNTFTVPQTTVSSVSCQKCVPQHVTERVSILQIILGL